jgi:hypothetical protein
MGDHRFMFYHVQEWQREQEQMNLLLAEIRKIHRTRFWQHILDRLSTLFLRPRVRVQKRHTSIPLEAAVVSEEEKLVQNGFTSEEIFALYKFRQWYQMSGREDIVLLRHWEFLKRLVNNGRLEV